MQNSQVEELKKEFEIRVDEQYYGESQNELNHISGSIKVETIDQRFKTIVKNSNLLDKVVKSHSVN